MIRCFKMFKMYSMGCGAGGSAAFWLLAMSALWGCNQTVKEGSSSPSLEAGAALSRPSAAPATPALPSASAVLAVNEAQSDPPPAGSAMQEQRAPVPKAGDVLATFFKGLRELKGNAKKKHVRIAWLGDSHGAADFWSGALRTELQQRFGNGGPGFLHLGYRDYRHDGIKSKVSGKWKMRPPNPATRAVTGDGIFGLGGILFVASESAPSASITITEASTPTKLNWDLCYRLGSDKDELTVTLNGQPKTVLNAGQTKPEGEIRHLVLPSDAKDAQFNVSVTGGTPSLCGLYVEADAESHPGVVLDTLGINGARFATPLAWNEDAWIEELKRHVPDLVILEYGTNEMSDYPLKTSVFSEPLSAVMARIRKVRPDVNCVVLAPTDRADTADRVTAARDAVREGALESGCAFWDTLTIMGGKGSIRAWADENPPRAAKDGIHLSWRGYRELGQKLAEDLMRGYTP